jgi:preprotein translocase subunit SecF
MSKTKKILLSILVVGVIAAGAVYYYVYKVNHGVDVHGAKGIEMTADQLVQEFNTNEDSANKKYLNKVLQVTGEVSSVKQDSTLTNVTLKTSDMLTSVYLTLVANEPKPDSGKTVTIKGICTGKLSDVVLNEAIIIKK